MSYSVIIPSRNIGNLTACVSAIRAAGETCRVIVVWDGETGNDEANGLYMALCMSPIRDSMTGPPYPPLPASFVEPGVKPFIFARNCNIGIRAAGNDDVILANDDALLKTHLGFRALSGACHSFGFGAMCPGFTVGSVGTHNLVNRNRGDAIREEKVMLVFACVFIPRTTIDRVGLLDERFGINAGGPGARGYGLEDDDYSLRIRKAGMKLGVYDGVLVDHTTLRSTFRCDPEHKADVRLHEDLFKRIHGHWPERTQRNNNQLMITSKEGIAATDLAAKMARLLSLQDGRTSIYAAMLLMVAVIDQWPGDVPKPLLDMRAYMQGNIGRMELALRSGRFGRPQ